MTTNRPAIEITSVSRSFRAPRRANTPPRAALNNCSLTINPSETLAILGPNGCGKSTLLTLVLGLDTPDTGTINVLNAPAHSGHARRLGQLAAAHQTPGLDPLLTVRENLALFAALHNINNPNDRITHAARIFDIADRLDDRVATLSGGLARRADLARATLPRPAVLVLDEPAAGLDIAARRSLANTIAARETLDDNATILIATHHTEIAERAHRVALMHNGTIIDHGPPHELANKTLGGQHTLTTTPNATDLLQNTQLTLHPLDQTLVAAGTPHDIRSAAAQLLEHNHPVTAGPATLDHAYLVAAGAALADTTTNAETPTR